MPQSANDIMTAIAEQLTRAAGVESVPCTCGMVVTGLLDDGLQRVSRWGDAIARLIELSSVKPGAEVDECWRTAFAAEAYRQIVARLEHPPLDEDPRHTVATLERLVAIRHAFLKSAGHDLSSNFDPCQRWLPDFDKSVDDVPFHSEHELDGSLSAAGTPEGQALGRIIRASIWLREQLRIQETIFPAVETVGTTSTGRLILVRLGLPSDDARWGDAKALVLHPASIWCIEHAAGKSLDQLNEERADDTAASSQCGLRPVLSKLLGDASPSKRCFLLNLMMVDRGQAPPANLSDLAPRAPQVEGLSLSLAICAAAWATDQRCFLREAVMTGVVDTNLNVGAVGGVPEKYAAFERWRGDWTDRRLFIPDANRSHCPTKGHSVVCLKDFRQPTTGIGVSIKELFTDGFDAYREFMSLNSPQFILTTTTDDEAEANGFSSDDKTYYEQRARELRCGAHETAPSVVLAVPYNEDPWLVVRHLIGDAYEPNGRTGTDRRHALPMLVAVAEGGHARPDETPWDMVQGVLWGAARLEEAGKAAVGGHHRRAASRQPERHPKLVIPLFLEQTLRWYPERLILVACSLPSEALECFEPESESAARALAARGSAGVARSPHEAARILQLQKFMQNHPRLGLVFVASDIHHALFIERTFNSSRQGSGA